MITSSDGVKLEAKMLSEMKWESERGEYIGKTNDGSQGGHVQGDDCIMEDMFMNGSDHASTTPLSQNGNPWTPQEDKIFEMALTNFEEGDVSRWQKLSDKLTGRDVDEIKRHYELLVEDIKGIEEGLIQSPLYNSNDSSMNSINNSSPGYELSLIGTSGSSKEASCMNSNQFPQKGNPQTSNQTLKQIQSSNQQLVVKQNSSPSALTQQVKPSEQERRKGIPWTEEEHRLFLLGLAKFGKGDWRSISRNYVISRTPTQVASHAQKYFIRLNSINKDKRRSSIHDITSINNGDSAHQSQGPITGQPAVSPPAGMSHGQPSMPHPPPAMSHGMYPQQLAPAHGMPMMAMPPPGTHVAYPPRGHMARPVMSSSAMPMTHMGYVSPPAMHH